MKIAKTVLDTIPIITPGLLLELLVSLAPSVSIVSLELPSSVSIIIVLGDVVVIKSSKKSF